MTWKSIESVSRSFRNDLYDIVNAAFENGGAITRDMRALVKTAVEDSYFEGLAQGGVTPDQMDEEDALNVIQLNLTQQDYVKAFSDDVRKAAKVGTAEAKNAILRRIDLWAASIAAAGQAGLNSAKANELVVFDGDDGDESCQDCQRYKREAHRRKWFVQRNLLPATPGSALQCGGWRCQHYLSPVR